MSRLVRSGLLALLLTSAGCAPMTFSHDAELDFEKYPSVLVSVNSSPELSGYLVGELRKSSGFSIITTDPAEDVRLVLTVTVNVEEDITVDSEGNTEIDYDGTAAFSATTPSGADVLHGTESDTSESADEAAEDVLDEVALRFIAPYRI